MMQDVNKIEHTFCHQFVVIQFSLLWVGSIILCAFSWNRFRLVRFLFWDYKDQVVKYYWTIHWLYLLPLSYFFLWWFCFPYFKEQVLIYVSNSREMCTCCFLSPSNAYCIHYMLLYIVWHLLNLFRLVCVQLTSS